MAFASSLDQIGPLARTVEDCALLLEAIAGHDPRDSTSVPGPVPPYAALLGDGRLDGLRVGVSREFFAAGLDAEVERAVRAAVRTLEERGARVEEVSLPHGKYAVAVYYILATAEASSNLARYDGVRYGLRAAGARDLIDLYRRTRGEGFGPEVKRRIMLGTYALSAGYYDAYYRKAQQVRTLIRGDFTAAFREVDVLAGPTAPTPAFRIGEKSDDPLQMYLSDIFTISVNLAGRPGPLAALRLHRRRAADRAAADRPGLRRGDAAARRARLPARDRLAHEAPAAGDRSGERRPMTAT